MSISLRAFIALAAIYAIVWFVALGYRDLVDPDEGRYAEIPREMLATNDWLTPRLDGLKYFEKPPLQYWLTAATFKVFGMSNTTARLWLAFIGYLGALVTAFVAWRLYGREAGWYAFIVASSALLYCGAGHYLTLDMSVSVFLFMGIASLVLAQQCRDGSPGRTRNWMLVGYAALAAATMTKGLIGVVLPAAAVFFYSLWQRDWAIWRHLHLVKGTLLLLALTAPWFVMVSDANPKFAWFFFVHEHLERYATPVSQHPGAPWYFLVVFFLGMLPWTMTSVTSLVRPAFNWRSGDGRFNAERFLWVYVVFILVFFSIGESKLVGYILPVFPVVAVLVARRMANGHISRLEPWLMWGFGAALFVTGLIITRFAYSKVPVALFRDYQPWIIASGVIMLVAGLVVYKGRAQPKLTVAVAGLFAIITCQFVSWGYQALTPSRSGRQAAETIAAYDPSGRLPVYMINNYSPSLPFYLRRLVTMVVYQGELKLGIDAEPWKSIPKAADFVARWRQEDNAIAVFSTENIDTYRKEFSPLPMTILKRGPRRTVVARSAIRVVPDK